MQLDGVVDAAVLDVDLGEVVAAERVMGWSGLSLVSPSLRFAFVQHDSLRRAAGFGVGRGEAVAA